MNALAQIHDDAVLRIIQEWLYAYSPLTVLPLAFLLLGLPTHRRIGAIVTMATALFALICLILYGALSEAPVLGWTLVIGLILRGTQLVSWLLPPVPLDAGSPVGKFTRRIRPRAGWFTRIARDYLRADPRGVYWFDLARASHGLPIPRSKSDRRSALVASPDLPAWRTKFWHGLLARLAERRIALLQRLPNYWLLPQTSLDLNEPAMRLVLEAEIDHTQQMMRRGQAGENFQKFRERAIDTHQSQAEQAGRYGLTTCLLREALAEYLAFREPWQEEESGLLAAAVACHETWQLRSQFDVLWHPSPVKVVPDSVEESKKPQEQPESEVDEAEPAEDRLEEDAPLEDDNLLTDEALFESVVGGAEPEVETDSAEELPPSRSIRDDDRLRDLQTACSLLEAYLGVTSTGNFREDVERWERLLDRPSFRLPGMMLLMMHCLRTDQTGANVDRIKLEVRARLRSRFRGPTASDTRGRRERQSFEGLYVDLLFDRGEYASVRTLFSEREELSPYQWKLLGDATSALATQLRGQEELRDLLQYEAIGYYFRSGQAGLWTLRTAGPLLGVETTRELIDQFDRHPVKVSRPLAGSLAATAGTRVGRIETFEDEEPAPPPPKREARPTKPVARVEQRPVEPIVPTSPPVSESPPPPERPAPPKPQAPKPTLPVSRPAPVAKPAPQAPPAAKPAAPVPPVAKPAAPASPPIAKPAVPTPPIAKPVPPVAKPGPAKPAERPAPPPVSAAAKKKSPPAKKAPLSAPPVVEVSIGSVRGGVSAARTIASFPHTIGKAAPAHLVIPDSKLSGVHFMLTWEGGKLTMRDPNGHGVFVNGEATKLIALNVGDRVQAGETVMEVVSI